MPFKPLVTAGIESLLNTFLYRSPALKTARSRLLGKVLRVEVKGFSTSLILVFSERQVDVLGEWAGDADCTVIAYASVLPKLRDRQQLAALIRSGELEVQGDIQVVQNFVALADLAEFDPAELLAPYTGDIAAEGISKAIAEAQSSCITALSASNVMWRKPLLKSGVWHPVRLKWPGLRKRRLPSSVLLMP
ncbi:sterol-binding domain-containing protein [Escherichia coli]|nr:sterol-binding domain-containing protein [Escherichia coli]